MLKLRLLVLLIPLGMTLPSVDADASRSPSRFCTPSEKNCRLSSWLAPAENRQKGVVSDQDDVRTSEPIAKTVTEGDSNTTLQKVVVEPRRPRSPVASGPRIRPQPDHDKTTLLERPGNIEGDEKFVFDHQDAFARHFPPCLYASEDMKLLLCFINYRQFDQAHLRCGETNRGTRSWQAAFNSTLNFALPPKACDQRRASLAKGPRS